MLIEIPKGKERKDPSPNLLLAMFFLAPKFEGIVIVRTGVNCQDRELSPELSPMKNIGRS